MVASSLLPKMNQNTSDDALSDKWLWFKKPCSRKTVLLFLQVWAMSCCESVSLSWHNFGSHVKVKAPPPPPEKRPKTIFFSEILHYNVSNFEVSHIFISIIIIDGAQMHAKTVFIQSSMPSFTLPETMIGNSTTTTTTATTINIVWQHLCKHSVILKRQSCFQLLKVMTILSHFVCMYLLLLQKLVWQIRQLLQLVWTVSALVF